MEKALRPLPLEKHPNLLVGTETADDAGVYRISEEMALVQTVDFITPIVDDPFLFGQIAAANSLSDVYAMGGKPLTAMNLVGFPRQSLDISILTEILRGGLEKIHEAGAVLMGGHTVEDPELKYGLSVTGTVHPKKIRTNRGAQIGDVLVLTKPLGTGIISTAHKAQMAEPGILQGAIDRMVQLNDKAAEAMSELPRSCLYGHHGLRPDGTCLRDGQGKRPLDAVHLLLDSDFGRSQRICRPGPGPRRGLL